MSQQTSQMALFLPALDTQDVDIYFVEALPSPSIVSVTKQACKLTYVRGLL